MTEVLRKMLVAGAAVAALSVAACGQPTEEVDANAEVAVNEAVTNEVVTNDVMTNDAAPATNEAAPATNEAAE